MTGQEIAQLEEVALRVRERVIRASTDGGCFTGSALSCADVLVYLYAKFLNVNEGNLDAVHEFFLPTYVNHGSEGDYTGPEVIVGFVGALREAFPDIQVEIEVLVTEGNKVAWLRTHRGTHQGDFMGIPASGREIVWQDIIVTRYDDGMIAEEWGVTELGAYLRESPE